MSTGSRFGCMVAWRTWWFAFFVMVLVPTRSFAGEVVLDDRFTSVELGAKLDLAYDANDAANADTVNALVWKPSTKAVPSFGYRHGTEWGRVRVDDRRTHTGPLVLQHGYGQTDELVFTVDDEHGRYELTTGDHVPFASWGIQSRLPAVRLRPGRVREILVRLRSHSSHQLSLTLFDDVPGRDALMRDLAAQAVYFGALFIMLAYNALVGAATRSTVYALYVVFLAGYALLQLAISGLLPLLVPHASSAFYDGAMTVGAGLAGFGGQSFSRRILALEERRIGRILFVHAMNGLAVVLLQLLIGYEKTIKITLVATALFPVFIIVAAVQAIRLDRPNAKTFALAWAAFLVGVAVGLMRSVGLLPTNVLTSNAMQLGSAAEFLLLSFAMAERIKRLQQEATENAERARALEVEARAASERALAEQERANAELKRLDKLKDEFLANTSHELRTPLHGILGLTEGVLAVEGALSKASRERLAMVVASGRRLTSLVNDILDFSKLRHQAIALREKSVDLGEAVKLALAVVSPMADSKGLALVSEVPGDAFVRADEGRVQQILTNLLGNAVKFTASGSVVVRAEARGDRMVVSVRDTGIGIAKEAQARIFESFEQGDGSTARKFGGTGLGLAVTKQLVELHGGKVELASEPGKGSVFTFDLARADRAGSVERAVDTHDEPLGPGRGSVLLRAAGGAPSGAVFVAAASQGADVDGGVPRSVPRAGHLLVADDDPVNIEVLRAQLEPEGYTVTTARDGAEAVERLAENPHVDGVLLDVMMPKMTGPEAATRMRETHPHGTLPILMLTAKSRAEDAVVGMRAGASDYIGKPFHREELLQRVEAHVQSLKTARAFRRFVPEDFLGLLGVERFDALTAGIGQQHDVTILFTDVRNFTTRSEILGAEGIFRFINACLERFEPVVRRRGGFVDKFIGDAVMAIFPGDPLEAARAAEDLHRQVDEFNRGRPDASMPLAIGVGVHRGPVILGTVGGADRMEVTAIGDAVNVAARLESLTKGLGVGAVVSEEVLGATTTDARRVGAVRVKGRAKPVELFELLNCCGSDDERRQKVATGDRFQRGLRSYAQGDMRRAREHFAACLDDAALDRVAALYAERSARYAAEGIPAGFDGCLEGV